jgi:membrane protein
LQTEREQDWAVRLDSRIMGWLWREERPVQGPAAWANTGLQMLYVAGRNSLTDRVPFQANALTFITLLALVPALAISFSVAKGLGFSRSLREFLIQTELLASQREVLEQVLQYVQNTQVGTLGAVGVALLVVTLVLTISTVEETFNRIWNVPSQRSWLRKFTDYLSVLVICPLLVLGATGAWAAFSSNEVVLWLMDVTAAEQAAQWLPNLGPLLLIFAAFVFVYMFLPNTKVPFLSALTAGVIAALLWYLVQHLYIIFQVGVARYNAIYGGFATLPLFMIWLQVSWVVVLFGGQLSHAHHVCTRGPLPRFLARPLGQTQREAVALAVMYRVAVRFREGGLPYSQDELGRELNVMQRELKLVLDQLEQGGLVSEIGMEGVLQPARSLDSVSVADVVAVMRGSAEDHLPDPGDSGEEALRRLLARAREQGRQVLSQTTLLELAQEGRAGRVATGGGM